MPFHGRSPRRSSSGRSSAPCTFSQNPPLWHPGYHKHTPDSVPPQRRQHVRSESHLKEFMPTVRARFERAPSDSSIKRPRVDQTLSTPGSSEIRKLAALRRTTDSCCEVLRTSANAQEVRFRGTGHSTNRSRNSAGRQPGYAPLGALSEQHRVYTLMISMACARLASGSRPGAGEYSCAT